MAAQQSYYELYRGSSLGLSLTDTLDDLINEGRIEPQLAMKILSTFDKVVTEVLAEKVRARLTFKGHLDTYRFCDEVWTFLIKDVTFKLDNQTTVTADRVKIVSCNSKRNTAPFKPKSTPRKRVKRERTPEDDDDATPRKPPTSPEKRDFFRSSQTPPTSPARPCPAQEFLIEGLDHDDAWVMVEDEFYAIAQSFTQHLHYAEYVRRKKEAKARSTEALNHIQRPTDGRTQLPKETERRKEAEALAARQKAGLAHLGVPEADKDDSDDDDTWAGTHLHDLLTSPRKSRSLVGAQAMKSSTRAAAGFRQAAGSSNDRAVGSASLSRAAAAHIVELHDATTSDDHVDLDGDTASDEDDDLDGQARPVSRPQLKSPQTNGPTRTAQPPHTMGSRNDIYKQPTIKDGNVRVNSKTSDKFKSRVQMLFDDFDELPEPSPSMTSSTTNIKNSQACTKSVGQRDSDDNNLGFKNTRLDDVPTFLG
ncbi:Transcription initiation factor IIA subunit 2 [Penicillium rolfsii]|nr:Transcription initiation factor IIA subunit 2 [Penicillium rolfsii]